VFSLDGVAIPGSVELRQEVTLAAHGGGLAGVLDRLRDQEPERFEALNDELHFWLPEFDRVLFETRSPGVRAIRLRMTEGGHAIPAQDLSQGTLFALAILTISYSSNPPPIVGLEEPDRGLHPRLLRVVRDAVYRLAYPDPNEDMRPPVQVIATTHSPYMLDQFKDHPEEVVIANKVDGNVKFERLSDRPDLDEILKDSALGDVWYSGILGGVPAHP
jgi:predicted ATPase